MAYRLLQSVGLLLDSCKPGPVFRQRNLLPRPTNIDQNLVRVRNPLVIAAPSAVRPKLTRVTAVRDRKDESWSDIYALAGVVAFAVLHLPLAAKLSWLTQVEAVAEFRLAVSHKRVGPSPVVMPHGPPMAGRPQHVSHLCATPGCS